MVDTDTSMDLGSDDISVPKALHTESPARSSSEISLSKLLVIALIRSVGKDVKYSKSLIHFSSKGNL
jgi:hypothetical protein